MCVQGEKGEGEAGQAVEQVVRPGSNPLGPPPPHPLHLREALPHLEVRQDRSQNLLINQVIRPLSKISVAVDGRDSTQPMTETGIGANKTRQATVIPTGTPATKS